MNREINGARIFCIIKGPGKTCQPGVGMVPTPERTYLYWQKAGIIIQMISGGPSNDPLIQIIKGDKESIALLENWVLDPQEKVKTIFGDRAMDSFKTLLRLFEEKKELQAALQNKKEGIQKQFNLITTQL